MWMSRGRPNHLAGGDCHGRGCVDTGFVQAVRKQIDYFERYAHKLPGLHMIRGVVGRWVD